MDEVNHPDDAAVVALLRRTLAVRAADIDLVPASPGRERQTPARPPRDSRRWVAVAACVVIAAGAAGVVVATVAGPRRSDPDRPPVAAATPTTPVTAATPTPTAVTAASPDALSTDVAWVLPDWLPPGYELLDVAATPQQVIEPSSTVEAPGPAGSQRWVAKDPDGTLTAWIDLFVTALESGAEAEISTGDEPNASVHGNDATLWEWGDGESGGWTVTWPEDDSIVTMQGSREVSRDDLLALAEASTVAAGQATIDAGALPTGFEPVAPTAAPTTTTASSQVVLVAAGPDRPPILVYVSSATGPLDAVVETESERRTVDGIDYSVSVNEATSPAFTTVLWITDGRQYSVSGRVDTDTAMAVATSLVPASEDQAAAASAAITTRVLANDPDAVAVFANGIEASTRTDSTGHAALCVDAAEAACVIDTSEAGLGGVAPTMLYDVFTIDGTRHVIGWHAEEPDITVTGGNAELIPAGSGAGWVVDIPVADGAPLPSIEIPGAGGATVTIYPTQPIRPTPSQDQATSPTSTP